jgi:hypothetical protein
LKKKDAGAGENVGTHPEGVKFGTGIRKVSKWNREIFEVRGNRIRHGEEKSAGEERKKVEGSGREWFYADTSSCEHSPTRVMR